MDERACWIAFSVFPGIGPMRFRLLLEYFHTAHNAWHASVSELNHIGLGEKLVEKFASFRATFQVEKYIEDLARKHVHVLLLTDTKYPAKLKEISDAPFVLYVIGKQNGQPLRLDRTIGVVGTRKITSYGRDVTQQLVRALVAEGFVIVSGLAYGVDAVAHQTAIDAGGKTIAVLGCGIDIIAPPSNATLYRQICFDGFGAVVSEMPLGLRPNKGVFPARNRIISGLSLGVVVTEGADDSGALITARTAAEQGREVFAVPGPITSPYSKGPAILIKKGATLVESVEDVLEGLGITSEKRGNRQTAKPVVGVTHEEEIIMQILQDGQMHIDELARSARLTMSTVAATITLLELKGIVKAHGDNVYGLV